MSAQIVIRLPEDQKTNLELAAERIGISFSEIVRRALSAYLQKLTRKQSSTKSLHELAEFAETLAKIRSTSEKPLDMNSVSEIDRSLYGDLSPKWGYLYKKKKKV